MQTNHHLDRIHPDNPPSLQMSAQLPRQYMNNIVQPIIMPSTDKNRNNKPDFIQT